MQLPIIEHGYLLNNGLWKEISTNYRRFIEFMYGQLGQFALVFERGDSPAFGHLVVDGFT